MQLTGGELGKCKKKNSRKHSEKIVISAEHEPLKRIKAVYDTD